MSLLLTWAMSFLFVTAAKDDGLERRVKLLEVRIDDLEAEVALLQSSPREPKTSLLPNFKKEANE